MSTLYKCSFAQRWHKRDVYNRWRSVWKVSGLGWSVGDNSDEERIRRRSSGGNRGAVDGVECCAESAWDSDRGGEKLSSGVALSSGGGRVEVAGAGCCSCAGGAASAAASRSRFRKSVCTSSSFSLSDDVASMELMLGDTVIVRRRGESSGSSNWKSIGSRADSAWRRARWFFPARSMTRPSPGIAHTKEGSEEHQWLVRVMAWWHRDMTALPWMIETRAGVGIHLYSHTQRHTCLPT